MGVEIRGSQQAGLALRGACEGAHECLQGREKELTQGRDNGKGP